VASTRSIEVNVHTSVGIVRPGDKLVLACDRPLDMAEADDIRTCVREQLPGVEPVIIEAAALAVYRP